MLGALGEIEISNAFPEFANTLASAVAKNGGKARIVDQPRGSGIYILTEALNVDESPAARHFAVLESLVANAGQPILTYVLEYCVATNLSRIGGNAGLCRSFRIERPGARTFSLSLDTATDAGTHADWIVHALTAEEQDYVLRADGGWRDEAGPSLSPPLLKPASDGRPVWLVTGGARGVTASCAVELARRCGGTLLLLGRSSPVAWPDWLPQEADLKALRGLLARNSNRPDMPKTPADIDRFARRLLASAEVSNTLEAIQMAGGQALYLQADISNAEDVTRALAKAQRSAGAVTGLVHGAGVLSDGRTEDLRLEDFEKVFGPKVDGLATVLSCLDGSSLEHVAMFSSASAVFGNMGQANYAAANAWLNNVALQLSQMLPDAQVKSFCWGPWQGGMVDEALARMFTDRGIGLISEPEGARIFADLLLNSPKNQVRFVIGDEWGAA